MLEIKISLRTALYFLLAFLGVRAYQKRVELDERFGRDIASLECSRDCAQIRANQLSTAIDKVARRVEGLERPWDPGDAEKGGKA